MKFDVVSSFGAGNIQALHTIKKISELNITDGQITFDLSNFKENNPFNNLLIANAISVYKNEHPSVNVSIIQKADNDFLSHLGFYHLIGADFGKKVGEAKPSNNYVPITEITFNDRFYDEVETHAGELAALLKFDKNLSGFLKYAFIETIRNVYEHAKTKTVYVCAQKWPTMNLVEIAIVDNGCGIATAMKKRFKDKNETELMYLAALPGISAKSNHAYLDKDNSWRNSGYGLYALRRLSKIYEGSFLLCSGGIALFQNNGHEEKFNTCFQGTAVAVRVKTNTNSVFQEVRKQVILEGEIAAKQISNAMTKASKSSGGKYYE